MIPIPEWFDRPIEAWPASAIELYRLIYIGMQRAQAATTAPPKAPDESSAGRH